MISRATTEEIKYIIAAGDFSATFSCSSLLVSSFGASAAARPVFSTGFFSCRPPAEGVRRIVCWDWGRNLTVPLMPGELGAAG